MKAKGARDVWTWMALDAETKTIPFNDAHVDTPLHSPNEWILKGFHPIAMGGRIM